MIKWILFDQAKVQTHPVFSQKKIFKIGDKTFKSEELENIFNTLEYRLYCIGKTSEKYLIEKYIKDNHMNLTMSEYILFFKKGIEPIKGMNEVLSDLKKNYKLAALINEGVEWAQYKFEVSDFRKYFDKIIISGAINCKKPEESFFQKALNTIKAKPEECIFIDDQQKNCDAAQSLGIKSIIFQDPQQLKTELKKYGIKVS